MTRKESRAVLESETCAINQNVDDYLAGRISRDAFTSRQRIAHDRLTDAGQSENFTRRWRTAA